MISLAHKLDLIEYLRSYTYPKQNAHLLTEVSYSIYNTWLYIMLQQKFMLHNEFSFLLQLLAGKTNYKTSSIILTDVD